MLSRTHLAEWRKRKAEGTLPRYNMLDVRAGIIIARYCQNELKPMRNAPRIPGTCLIAPAAMEPWI